MKTKIIAILSAIIVILGGGGYIANQTFGGNQNAAFQTVLGTSSNYKSLPVALAEANSTTTDAALPDGGATLNQFFSVSQADKVAVYIDAVGGTATSSFIMKPMFSMDGTNYYTKQVTATSTDVIGTTTPTFSPFIITFDPGTASTSKEIEFDIPVANFMRLVFMGEDLATDPNDGVQALVQVGLK